jgi:hypothetical protein
MLVFWSYASTARGRSLEPHYDQNGEDGTPRGRARESFMFKLGSLNI